MKVSLKSMRHLWDSRVYAFTLVASLILIASCSTTKKRAAPELSKLEGKKIALVEIDGESTAKGIVEVALINQLIEKGTFTLISKKEVEAARLMPDQNPLDLLGIAKRSGADYALQAKVLEFSAETKEGYSAEEIEDSALAAERGKEAGKTHRIFKTQALHGIVRIELRFTALLDGEIRSAVAENDEQLIADSKLGAIHFPPKLRFLEKTTNIAFKKFFERYQ
jgi:hypothetical protein